MSAPLQWLCAGRKIFPAMLEAIAAASRSVRLETYIFSDGRLGRLFADALLSAAKRGVNVSVLVDAFGSWALPENYFDVLVAAGAQVRRFNRLTLWRFAVRDHRKLLVCDDTVAFLGGFNISDEYDGDGVACGWCDVGARIENPALVAELTASFDRLFSFAECRGRPVQRLLSRRHNVFQCETRESRVAPSSRVHPQVRSGAAVSFLASSLSASSASSTVQLESEKEDKDEHGVVSESSLPRRAEPNARWPLGSGLKAGLRRRSEAKAGSFSKWLRKDLAHATDVRIISAYFLPTYRLRRALMRIARKGGRVQLILAGRSDVYLAQLAARNLYPRLLQAGVEIYEYEPQILHAKLICAGPVAYLGSANLDIRSLRLNYELMVRFDDKAIAGGAVEIFEQIRERSRRIEPAAWKKTQTRWQRWKCQWANFLLARVDPYVALRQFRLRK